MRRVLFLAAAALVLVLVSAAGAARPGYAWHDTSTGTTAHFRGLAAVSATTAWVTGYTATDGVIMRTTDRGATWQDVTPPDVAGLQFRDISAFSAHDAVAMSIGNNPGDFRIYVTHDGGRTWAITFVNSEPAAFYDCMSFFNRKVGLAVSDPPDGVHFRVIRTTDGGMSWHVTGLDMPAAPGAYGFAASGECLTTDHGHRAWFGSGGSEASVFRSNDRGTTWTKYSTPMLAGPTAGINGLAFNGQNRGIAVGGDFFLPTSSSASFARSFDGGSSWSLAPAAPTDYRSGVAWVNGHTAIAVGLSGSDVSTDFGATWQRFDDGSLDTVDCARPTACWASGANGRVAYLVRAR
ncbi:MAG TPA: hypothetical protein VE984_08460 [Gaiellaceae bacterium]|nr:hypothetical protein [Gaiellaceae bacterium]